LNRRPRSIVQRHRWQDNAQITDSLWLMFLLRARKHRVEAQRLTLPLRSLAGLGQEHLDSKPLLCKKGASCLSPKVLRSRSDAGRTYSSRRYSGMLDGIVVRLRKPIARLSRSSPSALRQSAVSFCVIFRPVCCDGTAPNPTSQTGSKSGVHFSQHSHAQNEQLKRGYGANPAWLSTPDALPH
jgi:hypothetical protein